MKVGSILVNFRKRLPTRADSLLVFGWCVFLVHVWAILVVLQELPSWAMRLGFIELLGVTAYPLVFAFLESVIVWAFVIFLSILLPGNLLRVDFAVQSATLVSILSIAAAALHVFIQLTVIHQLATLAVLLVVFLVGLYFCYLAGRSDKYRLFTRKLLAGVMVLAGIYMFVDLIGLVIIVSRNI